MDKKTVRRKFARIDEGIPLRYKARESTGAQGTQISGNISGGGILITINDVVPISTMIDIELELPEKRKPLKATAKVVRIEESALAGKYDIGLEFIEISDEDRKALLEFVENRIQIDIRFEETTSGENITVVRLSGYLDSGTTHTFERSISTLIEEGRHRIVVECSGVNYVSSDGISTFLAMAFELKDRGGDLKLACVSESVDSVLDLIEARRFIDVLDTEEEALSPQVWQKTTQ